jgi:hypothetical protein
MRPFLLAIFMAAAVSGCEHYANLTPDDFDRGGASQVQFARDNYECQTEAVVHENIARDVGDPYGDYNQAYLACMTKRGYRTTDIDLLGFGG